MKQKIEIEVDVPEGWKLTGEYRQPRQGEFYLDEGESFEAAFDFEDAMCPILRKVEPKRETRWGVPKLELWGWRKRETAVQVAKDNNIKQLVALQFENGQPVAVSLEPLSEEGA